VTKSAYLTEYDGIVKTMQMYIDGSKQGKSKLMGPAFHPDASFFGYAGEQLAIGTQFLFDWIDKNGPAPGSSPGWLVWTSSNRSLWFVLKSPDGQVFGWLGCAYVRPGDHISGFIGIESGLQAPPGLYVRNLVYVYTPKRKQSAFAYRLMGDSHRLLATHDGNATR
jgi:hypothetical protein